jgi:hypothetical protein
MTHLYICRDGQTVEGPFSAEKTHSLCRLGEVDPLTPVCVEGCTEWVPFQDFFKARPDLFSAGVDAAQEAECPELRPAVTPTISDLGESDERSLGQGVQKHRAKVVPLVTTSLLAGAFVAAGFYYFGIMRPAQKQLREIARIETASAKADETATDAPTARDELQAAANRVRDEDSALAQDHADTELRIAELKGSGFEREYMAAGERIGFLERKIKVYENRGKNADQIELTKLKTEKANAVRLRADGEQKYALRFAELDAERDILNIKERGFAEQEKAGEIRLKMLLKKKEILEGKAPRRQIFVDMDKIQSALNEELADRYKRR